MTSRVAVVGRTVVSGPRAWIRVVVDYPTTTPRRAGEGEGAYDYSLRCCRELEARERLVVKAAGRPLYAVGGGTLHRQSIFRFKQPLAARAAMQRIRKLGIADLECRSQMEEVTRG